MSRFSAGRTAWDEEGEDDAESTCEKICKSSVFPDKPRHAYFVDFPSYIDHAFGINTEEGSVDVGWIPLLGGHPTVNNPRGRPLNDVRFYA